MYVKPLIVIGASEASPFLVMNVEILSVCLCVCHGPARYSFFVLVTLYQPLRESMRMGTMKLGQDTGHRHGCRSKQLDLMGTL